MPIDLTGIASIASTIISSIPIIFRGLLGKPRMIIRNPQSCELLFANDYSKDIEDVKYLEIYIAPGGLELKDGDGFDFRFECRVTRHNIGSLNHNTPLEPCGKFKLIEDKTLIQIPDFPGAWVEEFLNVWEIEVHVRIGNYRRRLFKGHPSSVKIKVRAA